jgi:hypothetical protein
MLFSHFHAIYRLIKGHWTMIVQELTLELSIKHEKTLFCSIMAFERFVSCCYLFRCKARNIYSPIDYISILRRRVFMSVMWNTAEPHTFYYHEKISCLWRNHWPASKHFSSIFFGFHFWHWTELRRRWWCWVRRRKMRFFSLTHRQKCFLCSFGDNKWCF